MHLDIHTQNKIPVDLTARSASFNSTYVTPLHFFVGTKTFVFILTISLVSTAINHKLPFFIQCVNKEHHSYTTHNAVCFV